MNKETKEIPKKALIFADHDCVILASPATEDKPRSLKMIAYSGKVIKDHWYWGDLVIDTQGMKLAKKKTPILYDHDTDKKIGFGEFGADENHAISLIGNPTYVETSYSQEFIALSDQGFPFEASIRSYPTKIQRLMENEETDVNGFKLKGPATVWRESVLRECSVVTFGYDPNTKSVAMSEGSEDVVVEDVSLNNGKKEDHVMDLTQLKAEHPNLYAEVLAIGRKEAETEFSAIRLGLEAQVTELSADKAKLTNEVKANEVRLSSLEKSETLRREQEMKSQADSIFLSVMGKNPNIPERLHGKIRKLVNHQSFIKDDNLDTMAFREAVELEAKDWVSSESEDPVQGFGQSRHTEEGGISLTDADKIADNLFAMASGTKH